MTTLSAASASIDVPDLADLVHEKTLASARFMKSVRARSQQGLVFVKAVMKPYPSFEVQEYKHQITEERNILSEIPNALGYQRIVEVGSGGFLVRQYMFSSVYDRMSTRPFLEDIEKKWLAFQLLCAVRDCHARNVYHGDIKTENLLVTSWNWLYLTDFSSSFKPTNLPEDNPADFSFYFDTSSRRTCYIAPERFTTGNLGNLQAELNWAMDMFSVGCAIAEIFLEGPIFSLSQIFKYRSGEYSPEHTHLNKIEDPEVRAMILNMIELDPEKRYSAEQHLSFYRSKVFPEYFYSFLHQYMLDLTQPGSGSRPIGLDWGNLLESDEKIERVYYDFDKISYFLGFGTAGNKASTKTAYALRATPRSKWSETDPNLYDGSLLFLTLVASSMRNTAKASARLKACDLLVAFAERLPDEAKLDRVLPYIVGLLSDKSDVVRIAALQAMTAIFDMIQVVSPINAYVFPEYVFPRLKEFVLGPTSQPTPLVRAAYASSLASLALSSARILDMVHAIRTDGRLPSLSENYWAPEASYHGLYDVARAELVPHFEEATVALITDPEPSVRRALLGSVSRLCVFFGSSKASDVILTHLNTYLNDKDWILRCSFFDALVGVASYVGTSSLQRFILPIMVGSLTDPESFVVEKVFRSLSRMAALGLFQKSTTWELASIAARYFPHPSSWIRESAVQFVVQSSKYISTADKYCIIMPIVQPFLKSAIPEISAERILDNLKKPLSRVVFDSAIHWASRKSTSLFWTAAVRDGGYTLSDPDIPQPPSTLTKRILTRIPPSQRDKEDQAALESLRNLGMTAEDEIKLLALREYILKVSKHKPSEEADDRHRMLNNIIPLNQINVTPQNVFFDQRDPFREVKTRSQRVEPNRRQDERHTLADALLDASTTVADSSNGKLSQPRDGSGTTTPSQSSKPIDIQGRPSTGNLNASRPTLAVETTGTTSKTEGASSSGRPSPSDVDRLSLRRGAPLELKHRNSGINLMNRNDATKADAEISTSSETAFGKLDGPLPRRNVETASSLTVAAYMEKARAISPRAPGSPVRKYEANHSYTGNDPNVLKLLDNHFLENFPVDLMDFGQNRPSVDVRVPIRRATDPPSAASGRAVQNDTSFHKEPWRPSGQLLTQFAEHTAAINRVCAAPDHAFFVTASDDGTCKIWDTTRLEKNVTARSRHTHRHAEGSKVKSLCFVENTHTFISAADDGSIHAVRVDYKSVDGGESTRYRKPVLVRDYTLPSAGAAAAPGDTLPASEQTGTQPAREYAIWLYHYRTPTSQSILLAATNQCRVVAIDMKNMDVLHSMRNPVHHGAITSFCIDKKHHWLLLGTSHGILDLWDLRFKLRLRSFGIQAESRIDRIIIHPTKGHGRWVMVSAGGEMSVWDIEKMICREVLRPSAFHSWVSGKPYEPWFPDEESSAQILARFAKEVENDEALIIEPRMRSDTSTSVLGSPSAKRPASSESAAASTKSPPALTISAMYVLNDYLHNAAQPENPNKAAILFTGGADRALRYWDIARPEQSFIVSGPQIDSDDGSTVKVRYEVSHPLSLSARAQIALVQERVGDSSRDGAAAMGTENARTTPRKQTRAQKDAAAGGPGTPSSTKSGGSGASKPPRNTIISAAQKQLLRTHMDGITDVVVLRKPYGCVVSVDRGGCVFVFH